MEAVSLCVKAAFCSCLPLGLRHTLAVPNNENLSVTLNWRNGSGAFQEVLSLSCQSSSTGCKLNSQLEGCNPFAGHISDILRIRYLQYDS